MTGQSLADLGRDYETEPQAGRALCVEWLLSLLEGERETLERLCRYEAFRAVWESFRAAEDYLSATKHMTEHELIAYFALMGGTENLRGDGTFPGSDVLTSHFTKEKRK